MNALSVNQGAPPAAPYFNLRGLLLAGVAAFILLWPALASNGLLVYFDTIGYFQRGEGIANLLAGESEAQSAVPAESGGAGGRANGLVVRSSPYSLYTFLAGSTPLGLYLVCWLQTVVVIWAGLALVPQIAQGRRATFWIGLALVGTLSGLAWFASYAMPDILGAIVPIYYAVVLRNFAGLAIWQVLTLGMIVTAALLAHYGNLPLAGGLAVIVLALSWWRGTISPRVGAAALVPLLLAAGLNFGGGSAATQDASVAPNRIPVLLARSLEDGPARWYLEDACPEAEYAICDMFETMPRNITEFLWVEEGLLDADESQMRRIREEEARILFEAFKRYPLQQSYALARNALTQFVSVGTDQMFTLAPGDSALEPRAIGSPVNSENRPQAGSTFDPVIALATYAAFAGVILLLVFARPPGPLVDTFALLIAALILNALIFGGLSAPVDRYQGRIAWLIPALLVVGLSTARGQKNALPERA